MTLQMYIVAWTTAIETPNGEDVKDHWVACDNLEEAKDLYTQLETHEPKLGSVLYSDAIEVNGKYKIYGYVSSEHTVKHLALCAPVVSEIYPCTDVIVWNQSKGTDTLDNLRFQFTECSNGLHIYPEKRTRL